MKLHHLNARTPVPEGMDGALAAFEREFTYPLGGSGRFRISHGEGYLPFFSAMGEAEVLLLEEAGVVQGVLSRVERVLELRGEGATRQKAHYLCDLKLCAAARGSLALPRLIRETKRAILESGSRCCYCVVMEGTGKLPTDYTGRLGVPRFERLGEIAILRIEGSGSLGANDLTKISLVDFALLHSSLAAPGYHAMDSVSVLRSEMTPLYLATGEGDACGVLEDTRRGKRLYLEEGPEMLSAHLSRFAYRNPQAGAGLLRGAVELAAERGLPALFVAVPREAGEGILGELADLSVTLAPAAVYGHALEAGWDWWIDTAEI